MLRAADMAHVDEVPGRRRRFAVERRFWEMLDTDAVIGSLPVI